MIVGLSFASREKSAILSAEQFLFTHSSDTHMQFDHHPFLQDHPELQETIHSLRVSNVHFAKLLREYDGICLEIGRAESDIPGYMMSDLDLEQLKKERLALKDALIAMIA